MARARIRQRYRRGAVVGLMVTATVLVGAAFARGAGGAPEARDVAGPVEATQGPAPAVPGSAPSVTASGLPPGGDTWPDIEDAWPDEGSGNWRYAADQDVVLGDQGDVLRFRVAVEDELDLAADEFAAAVDAILGDSRGWTAGEHRFRRVAEWAETDFTIFLATPGTSEEMCAAEGFHTDRFTSCRLPGQVVINVARWMSGAPGYGAPLEEYRAYAISHEVGHELGYGHEACPGLGRPAPVMLPQTLGLDGCTANGWPYLDGARYTGPTIP